MAFLSGLFGNYTKEGPGVEKDEPKKPPFVRFFQLYFRKFWQLIQLNLIFVVPAIVVAAMVFFLYVGGKDAYVTLQINDTVKYDFYFWTTFVAPLPLILLSPFTAGLCFVTRNYVREEHAFIFSDFKDAIKSNWKYFLLNGAICYLVYTFSFTSIGFYGVFSNESKVMVIPLALSFLFVTIFTFAQFYFPVMAITFDLKFKQLYKNAFIFAILGLPRNILLGVLLVALIVALYFTQIMPLLLPLIAVIWFILLAFSTCMYTVNFVTYPLIEKHLIKPYHGETEEEKKEEVKEEESALLSAKEMESLESEFIYVNGKLIRRDEYEQELQRRRSRD